MMNTQKKHMEYQIKTEQFMGMSHCGEVVEDVCGTVDLEEDEVEALVELMRKHNTSDVTDMGLEEEYPDIYEKLDSACYDAAYDAEETHWLWEGYYNGYFDYDRDELREQCARDLGFKFEYNEQDYIDEDGDFDEEAFEEDREEAFGEWLSNYIAGLSNDEAKSFFWTYMNPGLDLDHVDYQVIIPDKIIDLAFPDD